MPGVLHALWTDSHSILIEHIWFSHIISYWYVLLKQNTIKQHTFLKQNTIKQNISHLACPKHRPQAHSNLPKHNLWGDCFQKMIQMHSIHFAFIPLLKSVDIKTSKLCHIIHYSWATKEVLSSHYMMELVSIDLTLCWAQHGRLFTSCSAGFVEMRSLHEHPGLFALLR